MNSPEAIPTTSTDAGEVSSKQGNPESASAEPRWLNSKGFLGRLASALIVSAEKLSERLADRYVPMLEKRKERFSRELRKIPDRMQRVTNQARLVLELIDDFDSGKYRTVPWHTIAVAAAALLYSVSPSDVLPDVLPVLGAIDDIAVIALAMRIIRRDLEAYCRFKGYDPNEYF